MDNKIIRLFRLHNIAQSINVTSHAYNALSNEWRFLKHFTCDLFIDDYKCYIVRGMNLYVFDDGRHEERSSGMRINLQTGTTTQIPHPKLYYMELMVVATDIYAFGFYGYNETQRIVLRFLNINFSHHLHL